MANGQPDDDHSVEKQASSATTSASGNAAASDMGPNAISINIGGQGWGVGRAPSSSSGQGSRGGMPSSGNDSTTNDPDATQGFGDFDDYSSPVLGYSLLSGSRAGGRRTKQKKRRRRTRHKKTKKKTKHRRRKRRKRHRRRTRRKHHSRRRRRRRRRRRH